MTDQRGDIWRRTTIELGPLRITREYRCAPPGPHYPFYEAPRARSGGWRAAGVLGVILAVSAGGLSMAATRLPTPRAPGYSVSVPVPTRVIAPPRPSPVASLSKRTPAPVPAEMPTRMMPDDVAGDSGSRAAAVAAALTSGEVQEWYEAAGQVHGFVVAGEAEPEGAQTCRALSILTRAPGGADQVDQRRECRPVG